MRCSHGAVRYAADQAVTAMGRRCRGASRALRQPSRDPPNPSHLISSYLHLRVQSLPSVMPSRGRPPQVLRSLPFSSSLLVRHCLGQVSIRSTYWVHTCCCEMDMHTSSHRSTLHSCTIHHPSTHPHCAPSFICNMPCTETLFTCIHHYHGRPPFRLSPARWAIQLIPDASLVRKRSISYSSTNPGDRWA